MDPFAKVGAGTVWTPPSARLHNATVDAARFVRERAIRLGDPAFSRELPSPIVVTVRNDTGADIDRFGVLGIDTALIAPTDNEDLFLSRVLLNGTTPTVPDHSDLFVVTAEPIRDGAIGRAYIGGAIGVKLNVTSALHKYAGIDDGSTDSLKSAGGGPVLILWMEGGTGTGKRAYVLLGGGRVAGDTVRLRILGNASGKAVYTACLVGMFPEAVIDPATDFATIPDATADSYFRNMDELPASGSATTHVIDTTKAPREALGFRSGTAIDGKPVYDGTLIQRFC